MASWLRLPLRRSGPPVRRLGIGRHGVAEHRIARRRQPAHQPVRLDRVVEPGLRPTVSDAGLHGARRDFAPVTVEQWQLAAGFADTTLQIPPLRLGRPQRRAVIIVAMVAVIIVMFAHVLMIFGKSWPSCVHFVLINHNIR